MFEDFRSEIEAVIHVDEERVVTAFRDGKVIRLSIHTDKSRALEAAGVESG